MALINLLYQNLETKNTYKGSKNIDKSSTFNLSFHDIPIEILKTILDFCTKKDALNLLSLNKECFNTFIPLVLKEAHIADINFKNNSISKYNRFIRDIDARNAFHYRNGSLNLYKLIEINPDVQYALSCPSSYLYNDKFVRKYNNCFIENLHINYTGGYRGILDNNDTEALKKNMNSNTFQRIKGITFICDVICFDNIFPLIKDNLKYITFQYIYKKIVKKPLISILTIPNLTKLELNDVFINYSTYQLIFNSYCKKLRYLKLNSSNSYGDSEGPELKIKGYNFPSLRYLYYNGSKYSITFDGPLVNLSSLSLNNVDLNRMSNFNSTVLPKLNSLILTGSRNLSIGLFREIFSLTSLSYLDIDFNYYDNIFLVKEGYPVKSFKSNLIELKVRQARVDDLLLKFFINNTLYLEYLTLDKCISVSTHRSKIIQSSLTYKLPLKGLYIDYYNLSFDFVKWLLDNSPNLSNVSLISPQDKDIIKHLMKYPNIQVEMIKN